VTLADFLFSWPHCK